MEGFPVTATVTWGKGGDVSGVDKGGMGRKECGFLPRAPPPSPSAHETVIVL